MQSYWQNWGLLAKKPGSEWIIIIFIAGHAVGNGYGPYGYASRQNGGVVPTGNLVDVSPPAPPDRPKREGQPPPLEQAGGGGVGVAWGAPIPLTIKQFEE